MYELKLNYSELSLIRIALDNLVYMNKFKSSDVLEGLSKKIDNVERIDV